MTSSGSVVDVGQALAMLRADYAELLDDLGQGDRAFWVGSGVSREQVPGLEDLIRKLLTFLRDKATSSLDTDPHFEALKRILSDYLPSELDALQRDPASWEPPKDLSALVTSYSRILSQEVNGMPEDYLLWDAVDVRETYGSPCINPGPEHFLIAILVHEGVLDSIATTNWDGLIEKAVAQSTASGTPSPLAVKMTNDSFRTARGTTVLYKAHGCAVQAREDESCREYLVAHVADIAIWLSNPKVQLMGESLRQLAQTRRSLMLGLSMQDYNLLTSLAAASQAQPWPWDPKNPAYMFAEPAILPTQRDVLRVAYRTEYTDRRDEICDRSALGTFSGLLLGACTLHVAMGKLKTAIDHAPEYSGSNAVVGALVEGITAIETDLSQRAANDLSRLVELLRSGLSALIRRFFEPQRELLEHEYMPIHPTPARNSVTDPVRNLNIPELAVVLGLLGFGASRGHWEMRLKAGADGVNGVLGLSPLGQAIPTEVAVVITRDATATSAMKGTAMWASGPDDVLVIQATGARPARLARGLDGGIGSARGSRRSRRQAWLSDLSAAAGSPEDLLNAFRAGVSV